MARLGHIIVYILAVAMVLLAPLLGLAVAAVGAWQVILTGSDFYLPMGFALMPGNFLHQGDACS